jgi:uncharacterized membrane protein YgcG
MRTLIALAIAGLTLGLAGLAVAAATGDTYTYSSALGPKGEVPKPSAPARAKGTFRATVVENGSTAAITWKLTFRGLSGKAVAAHIHRGKAGIAGPVLVPLCGPCTSGKSGKTTIKKSIAELMELGRTYVNVHTAKNAAGEIRGQVKLGRKTSSEPSTDDNGGASGGSSGSGGSGGGGSDDGGGGGIGY